MQLLDQIQPIIQHACCRAEMLIAHGNPDVRVYMQARQTCRTAIQLLKTIILQDSQDGGKIIVYANRSGHFRDFQAIVRERCYWIDEFHRIRGLEPKHLIVLGPAIRPTNRQEMEQKEQIYHYAMLKMIRIWEIEEWN